MDHRGCQTGIVPSGYKGVHPSPPGSATLEYAFLLPLVLSLVLAVFQSILLLHDKAILEASLWNATSAAARLWRLSAEELTLNAIASDDAHASSFPGHRDMYWQLKSAIGADQQKRDMCVTAFRKQLLLELESRSTLPGSGLRRLTEADLDVRVWTEPRLAGSLLCTAASIPIKGIVGNFIKRLPVRRQACIGAHAHVIVTAPASFIGDVDWAIQWIGRTKGGADIAEAAAGIRQWIGE